MRSMAPRLGRFSLDRMVRAVEKVRERLLRAAAELEKAAAPFAGRLRRCIDTPGG